MGRLKRITELSEEEKSKQAERFNEASKRYYWRNKERIDRENREKYQAKKRLQDELRKNL